MKKIFFLLIVISVFTVSCKKDKQLTDGTPPVFLSLTAVDTTLLLNDTTTLSAIATGTELSYTWSYETYANLIPLNEKAIFSICHAGSFVVYCDVENPWGKVRKSVTIHAR